MSDAEPNPGAQPSPDPNPGADPPAGGGPAPDADPSPPAGPAPDADPSPPSDPSPPADLGPQLQYIVEQTVFVRGSNRPFGELTLEDVRARADELKAATGFGPTARVAPVARAWRELTMALERSGTATVSELDADLVVELAPKLWVVPPGGTLL